jgi:hypothetical protein
MDFINLSSAENAAVPWETTLLLNPFFPSWPTLNSLSSCKCQVMSTQVKLYYSRWSVAQSILVSGTHFRPATNFFSFFLWLFLDSYGFIDVGRPLWREVESVVFNFCWASPMQTFSGLSPKGLMSIFYYRHVSLLVNFTLDNCSTRGQGQE